MNQAQLQQEPGTTLPHIEKPLTVSEAAISATPLDLDETTFAQSPVVEKLLAVVEQNTRIQQKWSTISSKISFVFVLLYLCLKIFEWTTGHSIYSGNVFWIYAISAGGCVIGTLQLNRKAAAELTKLDDARNVGALVEVWNPQGQVNYNRKTRRQAETALIRLLPRFKASDAHLLKEHQRAVLRSVLDTDDYKNWGRYYDEAFLLVHMGVNSPQVEFS